MVEVEQDQRDVASLSGGVGDHWLTLRQQRAAVQKAGQRVGVGQVAGALFGLGPFANLAAQIFIAAPAEQNQRDVQDQRGGQRLVGPPAQPDQRVDDRLHHIAAGADEHQDRRHHDAAGHDVAPGAFAAIHLLRLGRCHCHMSKTPTVAGILTQQR